MSKQIKVIVNGNPYQVEIEDLTKSPMNVMVNGKAYSVTMESESDTVPVVNQSIKPQQISPKPVRAAMKNSSSSSETSHELRAPMPGLILDIVVKPGDKVTQGQNLMVLEAMKMKNAIRSPRDGVIQNIPVTEGQKVGYNDILVTFE
jgi:glutaconyl-CoA/methylmalonyl-CoA decarboxylase subunit gamma